MYSDLADHALGVGPAKGKRVKAPKPLKKFHAEELHDGTYNFTKHHGDSPDESGSGDLDRIHDMMEEHFGGKAEKKPQSKK